MDKTQGFGHYLDRTVKTIQIAYQKAFKTQEVNLTIEQSNFSYWGCSSESSFSNDSFGIGRRS